jgi:two-component system CheB/CheR fusion protein
MRAVTEEKISANETNLPIFRRFSATARRAACSSPHLCRSELRVSNEEILSMNEELCSANEELEISKEELQTVNDS